MAAAGGTGTRIGRRPDGQAAAGGQGLRARCGSWADRDRFHAGAARQDHGQQSTRIPEIRQYNAVRFITAALTSCKADNTHFTKFGRPRGDRTRSTGQDSERLPDLTPPALQTEKLQQNELFARLKQVDSISLALSEPDAMLRVRHDCLDRFFRANSPNQQSCPITAACPYCLMITNATHRYLLAKITLRPLQNMAA